MKKILLALLLLPLPSYAVSLYCTGSIQKTYVSSSGNLIVRSTFRNDYTRLCNLNGTANNISAITCSMWSSYVTTALTNKKKVLISFSADEGVACSDMATYDSAPPVRYVMLQDVDA